MCIHVLACLILCGFDVSELYSMQPGIRILHVRTVALQCPPLKLLENILLLVQIDELLQG